MIFFGTYMQNKIVETYDLGLVFASHRFQTYYVNLVNELSTEYKVCIYVLKYPKQKRSTLTQEIYLNLCKKLGADIYYENQDCKCRLLLVTPGDFVEGQSLHKIEKIVYDSVILLPLSPLITSLPFEYISQNISAGAKKVMVYNTGGLNIALNDKSYENILDKIDVIEVELPIKKYPAFDFSHLSIDYLIAYPSQVHYKDEKNAMNLFCNMRKLLKSVPNEKKVYLKQHNVSDSGNRFTYNSSKVFLFRIILTFMNVTIKKILGREAKWSDPFHVYKTQKAKQFIEKRAKPLSEVTESHNLNIDHFLPYVKEGVITGISGVIYNALINEVPVYNCDDQPLTVDSPNYHHYKNFYVSPCHGRLQFDPSNFNRVKNDDPQCDMIEILKNELSLS